MAHQSIGNPISAATNAGFNRRDSFRPCLQVRSPPVEVVGSRREGRAPCAAAVCRLGVPALGRSFSPPLPLIPFWLEPYRVAAGVGNSTACVDRCAPCDPAATEGASLCVRFARGDATGVAHAAACVGSSLRGHGPSLRGLGSAPFFESPAHGLAHPFAIGPSDAGPRRTLLPRFSASGAVVGVGHDRIASVSIMPVCELSGPVVVVALAEERESLVQAVGQTCGQDKEALTSMRRPDVRSSEQKARAPVAQPLKVCLDGGEPEGNMTGDVFEDDQRGLALGDDSSHGGPDVPWVAAAAALAGDAEGLARVAGCDAIHAATEEPAREASYIAVYRRRIQRSRLNLLRQTRGGKAFPLHVSECASTSPAREVESAIEPSDSGAEGEVRQGTNNHTTLAPRGAARPWTARRPAAASRSP